MSIYQSLIKGSYNTWKAILLLVLITITLHAGLATCKPLTFDTYMFGEPKPGSSITYTIELYTYRRLSVKVDACYYMPGYGWSNWKSIWEGRLEGGKKYLIRSIYQVT